MITLKELKEDFELINLLIIAVFTAPVYKKVIKGDFIYYERIGERLITSDDYNKKNQVDYRKFIVR